MARTRYPYSLYLRLDLHVTESPRAVIRAARSRLAPSGRSRAQRQARHDYLRDMLAYHVDALDLYRRVQSGRLA